VNVHAIAEGPKEPVPDHTAQADNVLCLLSVKKLCVLNSTQEIQALEQAWRKLEINNAVAPSVFESFEWVSSWCKTHLTGDGESQIRVFAGFQNDELEFLLPLAKSSHFGTTILHWMTEPIGQYGDILCAAKDNTDDWMSLALAEIAKDKSIDILHLRHVRKDGLLEAFAITRMSDGKYYEQAPFLDLTQFQNEIEYDARYTPVQRKRRKKIRKHLEKIGPLSFLKLEEPNSVDASIETALSEKNKWLSDRGRLNRIMGSPRHLEFLKELARNSTNSFALCMTELKAGDMPVSWEIAFQYRKTHFAYVTAHVNALTELSPARLHMDYSQRAAREAGREKFDLMVPHDVHKESWCSGMVEVNDYYLGLTAKGHIYGGVYLGKLRPLVRHIYHALPHIALRALQSCSGTFKS
jgi:CelD/BcsL family acetyltransferase involved in cellulose biosynthesis